MQLASTTSTSASCQALRSCQVTAQRLHDAVIGTSWDVMGGMSW